MSDDIEPVEPVDPVELIEPPEGDGLAWPDHDTGPTPPGGMADQTRKRIAFWDRIKILVAIGILWLVVFWQQLADDPILPVREAARDMLRNKWWITVVAALELVRQLHYAISERSPRWHGFWTRGVFGGFERRTGRISDWNRYRIGRAMRLLFFLAIIAVIAGAIRHETPVLALFNLPARLWHALPLFFQLIFGALFIVIEFGALFFLLSRGGVETYFPDDIKTRFSDVWGQDAVLDRVKENMLFLDDPESIERRGGYVPAGILLWGPPGTGKGQPVSADVMTPSGPRNMGDLLPGDEVMGADGRTTAVLEVHLLGERDLYRVSFSDGSSLRVTEDHLWQVHSEYGATKVIPTRDLAGRLFEAGDRPRFHIPMTKPVEFTPRELPLSPYVMGALLGDGTFRHQIGFSNVDLEILARVEAELPAGDGMVRKSAADWSIIGGATRTIVKELELFGRFSHEKHVPADYLWSSIEHRLALLQGLMDTDGHVDQRGVVEFHSTSERLAEDVRQLVESFGGTSRMTTRSTRYRHNGRQLRGRPIFIVRLALPNDVVPFWVPRKVERLRPRTKYFPKRRMLAIEPDGREEARCIKVDAPDHLYVTERFIVTHNTLMAEAVAGETGKPYVFVDPGAFINMFMGIGIIKVKMLFRKLRKLAVRYGGVIVFFDEADSLGSRGMLAPGGGFGGGAGAAPASGPWAHAPSCNGLSYVTPDTTARLLREAMPSSGDDAPRRFIDRMMPMMGGGGGGMGTLQALLTELSGLKKPRGFLNRIGRRLLGMKPKAPPKYRILVMMASNMPQALDEALLRPGRIDRIYKVGYPSKAGRMRTYEGYFAKVANNLTRNDIDKLATITPYATGATIKDLVNESLINAIRHGRDVIVWKDVIQAKQLKELGPPEDVEYIERERHAIAIHESCHAVMAYRVRKHLTIDIATIEKGGTYLGMVASIKPEDQFNNWRTEFEADILVSLASLAGERMFFDGDSSRGVSGDLETATTLATYMEGYWGMGSTVASHGVTERLKVGGGAPPGEKGKARNKEKDLLEGTLGGRIESKLAELMVRTEALLAENRAAILAVAHALETHKTMTGDDVEAIIEGRPGPLVDGSVYRASSFRQEAEDYHAQVVAAHKAHARVHVPLPVLNGQVQVEAISAHDAD
ncbi:MAG: ATPase central domain protein [Acidimicrobiales bacterium]|nr:ATPase central domain protein [Acidimicrobiales bacterium]